MFPSPPLSPHRPGLIHRAASAYHDHFSTLHPTCRDDISDMPTMSGVSDGLMDATFESHASSNFPHDGNYYGEQARTHFYSQFRELARIKSRFTERELADWGKRSQENSLRNLLPTPTSRDQEGSLSPSTEGAPVSQKPTLVAASPSHRAITLRRHALSAAHAISAPRLTSHRTTPRIKIRTTKGGLSLPFLSLSPVSSRPGSKAGGSLADDDVSALGSLASPTQTHSRGVMDKLMSASVMTDLEDEGGDTPRSKFMKQLMFGQPGAEGGTEFLPRSSVIIRKDFTTEINLSHQGIGDTLGLALGRCLGELPDLRKLDISDNRLTDASLKTLLDSIAKMTHLEVLKCGHNKFDSDAAEALSVYLASPTCPLFELSMSHADVDDGECVDLVASLATNRTLTDLDLSHNQIGIEEDKNILDPDFTTGGEAIAELLEGRCALKRLNLAWNVRSLTRAWHLQWRLVPGH